MMKTLIAVLLLAALAVGVLLLARYESFDWSTDSAPALAEFEAGLEALDKIYASDAIAHFEQALAADPGFAAAQYFLIRALGRQDGSSPQRTSELVEALAAQDLSRLNARERMLVGSMLARIDGDYETASRIVDDYYSDHPEDPYVLELHCAMLESSREVEGCLERLIELDPNRVQAQNSLGYLAFNRGDFAAAEERFRLYGYLAPDQANPHDSLGELLMVTGRYDEAQAQFRQAVALKGDFCASWNNLVTLELLRHDADAAGRVVDELDAVDGCPQRLRPYQRCRAELWRLAQSGGWAEAYESSRADCAPNPVDADSSILAVRAALASGHPEAAEGVIEAVAEWFRSEGRTERPREEEPFVLLLIGLAESGGGDPQTAAATLAAADEKLHWGESMGTLKLLTRLERTAALAAGGAGGAAQSMASLAAVNPRYAAAPPLPPLHPPPPAPATSAAGGAG